MRSRHIVGIGRQRVRRLCFSRPSLSFVRRTGGFHKVAVASLACGAIVLPTFNFTAVAAPMKSTTSGSATLSATPVKNLNATNARVKVTGKGFDQRLGIYVGLCVTPKKDSIKPGPCGGGINMNANNPASAWISSNPPPYGSELAIPFKKGGIFSVTLEVNSQIGEIDCKVTSCSIVTRADHTKSSYRGADLFIPVTFK
jgi:hypothetical protein